MLTSLLYRWVSSSLIFPDSITASRMSACFSQIWFHSADASICRASSVAAAISSWATISLSDDWISECFILGISSKTCWIAARVSGSSPSKAMRSRMVSSISSSDMPAKIWRASTSSGSFSKSKPPRAPLEFKISSSDTAWCCCCGGLSLLDDDEGSLGSVFGLRMPRPNWAWTGCDHNEDSKTKCAGKVNFMVQLVEQWSWVWIDMSNGIKFLSIRWRQSDLPRLEQIHFWCTR